ncbi:hypothetical protein Fmac_008916 [Flemingia macrophylla]|uniref:Uncharacterized protein n=1 Tax=Flemingia macrophylla TaxID=520843 RepID=A0ABD1MYR1_9FABA
MCPKASPNLNEIGSEGFDLIEKHYGRFRRPQVSTLEVPIIADSNNPSRLGGANIDNIKKPEQPRLNCLFGHWLKMSSAN